MWSGARRTYADCCRRHAPVTPPKPPGIPIGRFRIGIDAIGGVNNNAYPSGYRVDIDGADVARLPSPVLVAQNPAIGLFVPPALPLPGLSADAIGGGERPGYVPAFYVLVPDHGKPVDTLSLGADPLDPVGVQFP